MANITLKGNGFQCYCSHHHHHCCCCFCCCYYCCHCCCYFNSYFMVLYSRSRKRVILVCVCVCMCACVVFTNESCAKTKKLVMTATKSQRKREWNIKNIAATFSHILCIGKFVKFAHLHIELWLKCSPLAGSNFKQQQQQFEWIWKECKRMRERSWNLRVFTTDLVNYIFFYIIA